jgi:hypothetical protein
MYIELKYQNISLEKLAEWRIHWQMVKMEGLLDGKPLSLELAQETRNKAEADIEALIMEINFMFGDDVNAWDVKKLPKYAEYLRVRVELEDTAVKQHLERQTLIAHKALKMYEFR